MIDTLLYYAGKLAIIIFTMFGVGMLFIFGKWLYGNEHRIKKGMKTPLTKCKSADDVISEIERRKNKRVKVDK